MWADERVYGFTESSENIEIKSSSFVIELIVNIGIKIKIYF